MQMGGNAKNAVFPPGKRPDTQCTEGWAGPRTGLDGRRKSRPAWIRSPNHPARGESLHRLRYPGRPYRIEHSGIGKRGTVIHQYKISHTSYKSINRKKINRQPGMN
jgi:hypothetical protein